MKEYQLKKKQIYSYLVYNIVSLGKMFGKADPFLMKISWRWTCSWKCSYCKDLPFSMNNGTLAVVDLSGTTIILEGHLQWPSIFKSTMFLSNKHLQSSLISKVLS